MFGARKTIPDQLLEWSRLRPHELAIAASPGSSIPSLTWSELHRQLELIALGLDRLGLEAPKVLTILAPLELEATLFALAALRLGLLILWLDPSDPPPLNNYLIRETGSPYLYLSDPADLQALRNLKSSSIPSLQVILCDREKASPDLESLTDVLRAAAQDSPSSDYERPRPRPNDLAWVLPSTSRSLGTEVLRWTHQEFALAARLASSCLDLRPGKRVTSLLSPSLPGGLLAGLFAPLLGAATLHFAAAAEDPLNRLLRSRPRHLILDQEIAQVLARRCQTLWQESSRGVAPEKGLELWRSAARVLSSWRASLRSDEQPSRVLRLGLGFANAVLHNPLRSALGLESCESLALIGTSAAPTELMTQLAALALPISELVGPAEMAGILAWREAGTDPTAPLRFMPGLHVESMDRGFRVDCQPLFPGTAARLFELLEDPRQAPVTPRQSPDASLLSRARRAFTAHPLVATCRIDSDGPFDLDLNLVLRAELLGDLRCRLGLIPGDPRLELCLRSELSTHVQEVAASLPKPTTLRRWTWTEQEISDAAPLRLSAPSGSNRDGLAKSVKTEAEERCSKNG